jgi:hypothetical protein
MTGFNYAILSAILLLLAGCASVESEKPLSSPKLAFRDPRLEGLWRPEGKGASGYLYIAYRAKSGIGSVMSIDQDGGDGIGTSQYDFFVTRSGKRNYVNLSHGTSRGEGEIHADRSGHYLFVEYRFSWRGQLIYSIMNPNLFTKAVESGQLKGKVTYDENKNSDTLLKDSPERILKFIESCKQADIFVEPSTCDKIGGL